MILNEKPIAEYIVERKTANQKAEVFSLKLTNYRIFLITPPEQPIENAKYKFYYQDFKHESKDWKSSGGF